MKIQEQGFVIAPMPSRQKPTTAGEMKLAQRLAPADRTADGMDARVQHDVDCVAAILTLRGGFRSSTLEDSRAIFAADQPLVIRNVLRWWHEDENESGIAPITNIRAIANLAWLKKPAFSAAFKFRELISLCSSALRPSKETWRRFLGHLEKLRDSQSLTDDEMTAIIVSTTSDRLLHEAEVFDGEDIDVHTLDEIVVKVKEDYVKEVNAEKAALITEHKREMAELAAERDQAISAERLRTAAVENRRQIARSRAKVWAKYLTGCLLWISNLLLLGAVIAILREHFLNERLNTAHAFGIPLAVALFYILEATVLRQHIAHFMNKVREKLARVFLEWLDPESKFEDVTTDLTAD